MFTMVGFTDNGDKKVYVNLSAIIAIQEHDNNTTIILTHSGKLYIKGDLTAITSQIQKTLKQLEIARP